jgi:ribose 5-phosphate isomerase B
MIAIGSDHGGMKLKSRIIEYLSGKGLELRDLGTNDTISVDYPDYGQAVAEAVASGECDRGIVICGTGIGISMSANKVPGIRAALCTNSFMARMSREHNDANVLALGERIVGEDLAIDIVDAWLSAEFKGGRHTNRVNKISLIEKKYSK